MWATTNRMITIDPSRLEDIRELGPVIREADKNELIWLGFKPHHALYYSFKYGLYRKTGRVDNRIAGMWGVAGVPLGLVGQPYLITSPIIEEISPIKFAKIYKQEVEVMLKIFPILENYVDFRYKGAIRLMKIAGFIVDEPEEFGPNKALFCKFHKRAV